LATAYSMTGSSDVKSLVADVTTAWDVDDYKFTTPKGNTGLDGLTVRVKTAGLSLLAAKLTVYDAAGNVIGTAASTDPLSGDLAVTVPGVAPNAVYYAKVQAATGDVFAVGSYNLVLDYHYAGQTSSVGGAGG